MKSIFINIIIWLFEKYAFSKWIDKQEKEEREEIKQKYNLKTDEEVEEYLIDRSQDGYREAYYSGKEDGYNEALEDYRI